MALLKAFWILLRPLQWVKNAVVFAPLLFSGHFVYPPAVFAACLAFTAFCLVSSLSYVLNDICDLPLDRRHPVKQASRPLAAGLLSIRQAWTAALCCAALACALSLLLTQPVNIILLSYVALTSFYTLGAKNIVIVDLFIIAAGFMLRVFGGALAINVPVSSWMFLTMFCAALYLAAIKRMQELKSGAEDGRRVLQHYSVALLEKYSTFAAVGALLSYCLFVVAIKGELVLTVPIVFFAFFRYWYLVDQKNEGESPTDILVRDPLLLASFIIWTAICIAVIAPG